MRKIISFALALAAFGFISCSESSNAPTEPSVRANKTTQFSQDVTLTFYNDCCGEWVTLAGTIHGVLKDGKIHVNGQNLVATDENGNEYHGNLVENASYVPDPDGGACETLIVNMNFSGSGDCDFSAKIRTRACIDADGNITYTQQVEDIQCM